MNGYSIQLIMKDKELEAIMKDLLEAQEKIYECYSRLQELGVVTIVGEVKTVKTVKTEPPRP